MRRDDILREAAFRRLLVLVNRRRPSARVRLGRVARAFGYLAMTLADALG